VILRRPPAQLLDVGQCLFGRLLVAAVVDGDVGAVLGERERDRTTDAAASTVTSATLPSSPIRYSPSRSF